MGHPMNRLNLLEARRTDSQISIIKSAHETYLHGDDADIVKYIIGTMQPIDPVYTQNTFEQGERVRNQLEKKVDSISGFRYQGSVVSDTHIKTHSDIDLLVFREGWHFCRPPLSPVNPYKGDEKDDMRVLRKSSKETLVQAFPQATVDDSGKIAIAIEGGSLSRKVDVVIAVWEESMESVNSKNDIDRGVCVFNRDKGVFVTNYPFKSRYEILKKDDRCGGGMCKAARLMKSVKFDSGTISMTSYDITAIAWNMPDDYLCYQAPFEMRIFEGCRRYLREILNDQFKRALLLVPDGSREVFCSAGASVQEAKKLLGELDNLAAEIPSTTQYGAPIDLMELKSMRPLYEHKRVIFS